MLAFTAMLVLSLAAPWTVASSPADTIRLGEVQRIGDLDGPITVLDQGLVRISRFTPNGELIGTSPMPQPPSAFPMLWLGYPFLAANGRTLRTASIPAIKGMSDDYPTLPMVLASADEGVVDTIARYSLGDRTVIIEENGRNMMFPRPVFTATRFDVSQDGRYTVLVESREDGTDVTWHDNVTGIDHGRTLDHGLVRVPRDWADSVETYLVERTLPSGFSRRAIEEAVRIPRQVPPMDWIRALPDGRVWLRMITWGDSAFREWLEVDRDGSETMLLVPGDVQPGLFMTPAA